MGELGKDWLNYGHCIAGMVFCHKRSSLILMRSLLAFASHAQVSPLVSWWTRVMV